MTRRAPSRPKSNAGERSLRRKPVDAADIQAAAETPELPIEIEDLGPLHRTEDVSPPARPEAAAPALRDGRRALALTAVGLLCAVGAAAGVGKALSERGRGGLGPVRAHAETASAAPVAAPEAKPILADYRPPDRDQVRKAYLNVESVYRSGGLSGVVRQSIDCFDTLKQTPAYEMLDYCIAFDAFGQALARQLESGKAAAGDDYFGGVEPRDLAAARAVVGADGDANARVIDVRRLAGEVSQEGPAVARKAIAALSTATPSTAVIEAAPGAGPHADLRRPLPALTVAQAAPVPVAAPAPPAPKAAPVVVAEARPAPTRLAPPKPTPVKVAAAKAHRVEKHVAEPKPAFEHARLQRASSKVEHHARPIVTKAVVRTPPKPAPHHRLQVATRTTPRHEHEQQPRLFRAIAHTAASFGRAVKASLHPQPKPQTATVADRREPAEWIDCRKPRTLTESRICEDIDSGADGTLQGQLSRSKYEPSGHP